MGGAAMDNGRGAKTEGMMPRDKKATPEEVEKIKAHYERRGYGTISEATAREQIYILRHIRAGTLQGAINGEGRD